MYYGQTVLMLPGYEGERGKFSNGLLVWEEETPSLTWTIPVYELAFLGRLFYGLVRALSKMALHFSSLLSLALQYFCFNPWVIFVMD